MKILTVVGARPQFIKHAPVSKELRKHHEEVLVHTGQHYDDNMSRVFFDELQIPEPDFNLQIGSGSHSIQTGHMMMAIEGAMVQEKPDFVLVYGDTNSTLAGALAAAKLQIPIGHIEAGLRNFDMSIPEEINRVIADRLSRLLFCPTVTAVNNLKNEGIKNDIQNGSVYFTGDVMYDALIQNLEVAQCDLNLPKDYIYCTLHRPSNVDGGNLEIIINQLRECGEEIIFPIHPRTRNNLKMSGQSWYNFSFHNPVSYLESIYLIKNAKKVVTDSGGVQKEAYILKTPCITVFPSTAWEETVADGWNLLVEPDGVAEAVKYFTPNGLQHNHYGTGNAAKNIINLLNDYEYSHSLPTH